MKDDTLFGCRSFYIYKYEEYEQLFLLFVGCAIFVTFVCCVRKRKQFYGTCFGL